MKAITPFILILIILVGCNQTDSKQSASSQEIPENKRTETDSIKVPVQEEEVVVINEDEFLITETGVAGFNIGDIIDPQSQNIKKDILETGDGSFPIHVITDRHGDEVGVIHTDFEDEKTIRIIQVTSPKYKTREGLGVGSTYQDLKSNFPDLETSGSEIEGTTGSKAGGLIFELNVNFWSYNIPDSLIDPQTKVTQVNIMKMAPTVKEVVGSETAEISSEEVSHYICFHQDDDPAVTIWVSYSEEGKALQVKYKGKDDVTDLVYREEENTNEGGPYPVISQYYDVVQEGEVKGQYKITHSGIWDYVEYTRGSDSQVFNFTIDHEANPYGESPCF